MTAGRAGAEEIGYEAGDEREKDFEDFGRAGHANENHGDGTVVASESCASEDRGNVKIKR